MNYILFTLTRYRTGLQTLGDDARRARVCTMVFTIILTLLPFWAVTADTVLKNFAANRAQAAIDYTARAVPDRPTDFAGRFARVRLTRNSALLLQMQGGDIMAHFSQPQLKRREGPVHVWQYRNAQCVLDIFLQTHGDSDATLDVVHYEVRARDKAQLKPALHHNNYVSERSCLDAMLRGKNGAGAYTASR